MLKKTFFHRFLYYSCLISIPVIIIFSIFFQYSIKNITNQIQERSKNALCSVDDNYKLILQNSTTQYDMLVNNPRLSISLKKLLSRTTTTTYTDVVLTNTLTATFNSITNNNAYIDSIYYYLENVPYFLYSKEGVTSINGFYDLDWINNKSYFSTTPILEKRIVQKYTYADSEDVVSLSQALTMYKGLLVININPEQFETLLSNHETSNKEYLYVVNSNNEIIFSNSKGNDFYNLNANAFANMFDNEIEITQDSSLEYTSKWITIDSNKYLLTILPSAYKTKLVSLVSKKVIFQQMETYILFFIAILIILLFVSLALAYNITCKNFMQINYIVDLFSDAENGIYSKAKPKFIQDEYDTILNNVINLFISSSYLKTQLSLKEEKQKLAEFAALQLQINPHFLFNTLQTLNFKALEMSGQSTALNEIIEDLSDILKYSLEKPNGTLTLLDELTYLHKYDSIQHYRYENKYILYYEYEDQLTSLPFIRLILQPIVENSLYHGIKPLSGNGVIKLKIFRRNDRVYFYVIDSGIGMTKEEISNLYHTINIESSDSIGLANVNHRLILHYGKESELIINSKKNMGTCISFSIPMAEL